MVGKLFCFQNYFKNCFFPFKTSSFLAGGVQPPAAYWTDCKWLLSCARGKGSKNLQPFLNPCAVAEHIQSPHFPEFRDCSLLLPQQLLAIPKRILSLLSSALASRGGGVSRECILYPLKKHSNGHSPPKHWGVEEGTLVLLPISLTGIFRPRADAL